MQLGYRPSLYLTPELQKLRQEDPGFEASLDDSESLHPHSLNKKLGAVILVNWEAETEQSLELGKS